MEGNEVTLNFIIRNLSRCRSGFAVRYSLFLLTTNRHKSLPRAMHREPIRRGLTVEG